MTRAARAAVDVARWVTGRLRRVRRQLPGLLPDAVRRSMRVRVVVLTLLLGSVVVWGVGAFVLRDVARGLADNRRAEAYVESANAVRQLQVAFGSNAEVNDAASVEGLLNRVLPTVGGSPQEREVVLLPAQDNTSRIGVRSWVSDRDRLRPGTPSFQELVSPELRESVADGDGQLSQLVSMPVGDGSERVPAVVVGSSVELPPAGTHELYLVYPMDEQVSTLSLVERAFVVGGVALVALVGSIAWLVARIVVTPVRVAARTAEQFAAGELHRRMAVEGQDEVARLAASFNVMAESLEAQITRLESLSRLQQRFVSDVSHELRTPLTTIRMAADVLHDRLESQLGLAPDVRRSAELLSAQIDRFEALLSDLLEVSRFDAGAAVLDLVDDVDLVDLVQQAVELNRQVAERFDAPLSLTVGGGQDETPAGADARAVERVPAAGARAQVDARRVSRVLRNLLSNAIEHAEGQPVDVRVAADASAVAVGVRDHGAGLPTADAERVFDRFWRADPSRRRTLGGSGLGLAIALEDARLHGGRLEVWSRPGRGAHFVLTLPRRARQPLTTAPIALQPDDAGGGVEQLPSGGAAAAPGDGESPGADRGHDGGAPGGPPAPGGGAGDPGGGEDALPATVGASP